VVAVGAGCVTQILKLPVEVAAALTLETLT
jgi:hypothetical protein